MREITSEAVKPVSFHTQPFEPEGDVLPVPCPKELKQHIISFESGDHSLESRGSMVFIGGSNQGKTFRNVNSKLL
jgi:hypothetical protein